MARKHLLGCREGKLLSSYCLIWDVWARHSAKGENFSSIQPKFPFRNKTCTWTCGYSSDRYVRKEPFVEVNIRNYTYNFNLNVYF